MYHRFKYPGAARERIEVLIKRELGATITKVPPHDLAKLEALIAIFDKRARRYESMRKWPKNERTKEELADIMVLFGKNADLRLLREASLPRGGNRQLVGA